MARAHILVAAGVSKPLPSVCQQEVRFPVDRRGAQAAGGAPYPESSPRQPHRRAATRRHHVRRLQPAYACPTRRAIAPSDRAPPQAIARWPWNEQRHRVRYALRPRSLLRASGADFHAVAALGELRRATPSRGSGSAPASG